MSTSNTNSLDFRFADEEDDEVIYNIVNSFYKDEANPESCYFFRRNSDKITIDEINNTAEGSLWILLEKEACTIPIGVARISMSQFNEFLTIDYMAAIGDKSENFLILSHMLSRINSIAQNHNVQNLIIYIPQIRQDLLEWFENKGFIEIGGNLVKADYENNFIHDIVITRMSKSINFSENEKRTIDESVELHNNEYSDVSSEMTNLVSELFSALHRDI